jgi:hypothetical protein
MIDLFHDFEQTTRSSDSEFECFVIISDNESILKRNLNGPILSKPGRSGKVIVKSYNVVYFSQHKLLQFHCYDFVEKFVRNNRDSPLPIPTEHTHQ